jgi:uncharacterized protein
MGQPVVHWEITARDAGSLESFYREMFDWSVKDTPIRHRHIDTGTHVGIQGGIAETSGTWPSGTMFYVQVDDVGSYLSKAENLGASTLVPPTELNGATIGIFRDPQGVVVGLVQGSQE